MPWRWRRSASISSAILASGGPYSVPSFAPRVRRASSRPGGRAGQVVLQVDAEVLLVHRLATVPGSDAHIGSRDGRTRSQRARAGPGRRRRRRRSARRSARACGTCSPPSCGAAWWSSASRAPATACRSPWRSARPATTRSLAALPISPELRADPGAVGERAGALAAVAVEHVVEGASPGPPRSAEELALRARRARRDARARLPGRRPGRGGRVRARGARRGVRGAADRPAARARAPAARPRARGRRGPAAADRRDAPAARGRGGHAAGRLAARRGRASRRSSSSSSTCSSPPARCRARTRTRTRSRRVARRILQRLDGMGKWGSYHTAFDHLARGFAGHERALAYEVGEALLAAGLFEQKPSVGQRHVYLSPRRSGDIRRLIDEGELPAGLVLPPTSG